MAGSWSPSANYCAQWPPHSMSLSFPPATPPTESNGRESGLLVVANKLLGTHQYAYAEGFLRTSGASMPYDSSNNPSRLCRTLLLAGIALFSLGSARAMLPPSPATEALNLVGSGELRWFGLSIYEASLWTPEGQFDAVNRHQQV